MALLSSLRLFLLFRTIALVSAQGQCYWAAGAQYLLPPEANVVPCSNDGPSACCKLGTYYYLYFRLPQLTVDSAMAR